MKNDDVDALLTRAEVSLATAARLLDVAVVARRMSVTDQTVRNWIAAGKLDAARTPGGHYRVPVSELARLIKSQISQTAKL